MSRAREWPQQLRGKDTVAFDLDVYLSTPDCEALNKKKIKIFQAPG